MEKWHVSHCSLNKIEPILDIKNEISKLLESSEFVNKRASKMSVDDFKCLLKVFNDNNFRFN